MDDEERFCGGDDAEYADGPYWKRPKFFCGMFVFVWLAIGGLAYGLVTVDWRAGNIEDELARVHVAQFTLDGGMRPQFYTYNATGEWSVPSGIFMPADGRMYSRSWCTFSENTRTAQVRFIVQGTAETTSAQLENWVEFRFEVPYGLPIGVQPGGEMGAAYTRCPLPQCGTADYRAGIGGGGGFTNAESAFLTLARVSQNRTRVAPAAVTCGCSLENPIRMSCTFPGNALLALDGPLEVQGEFWYTTANVTLPPSA
jgi:hypothetical protein